MSTVGIFWAGIFIHCGGEYKAAEAHEHVRPDNMIDADSAGPHGDDFAVARELRKAIERGKQEADGDNKGDH